MSKLSGIIGIMVIMAGLMAGCTAFQGQVASKAAELSDAKMQADMWSLCEASTRGAIGRNLDAEQQHALNTICPKGITPVEHP